MPAAAEEQPEPQYLSPTACGSPEQKRLTAIINANAEKGKQSKAEAEHSDGAVGQSKADDALDKDDPAHIRSELEKELARMPSLLGSRLTEKALNFKT